MTEGGGAAEVTIRAEDVAARAFWSTMREVLIILLGIALLNAFSSLVKDESGRSIIFRNASMLTFQNVVIFTITMYRFGFANIILTEEMSREDFPRAIGKKILSAFTFLFLVVSAIIMTDMSSFVDVTRYGFTMYTLFAFLVFFDVLWDFVRVITKSAKHYQKIWLVNKLVWLILFGAIVQHAGCRLGLMSDQPIPYAMSSSPDVKSAYDCVIVLTICSSLVSLCAARDLFFPFLFPPRLAARSAAD